MRGLDIHKAMLSRCEALIGVGESMPSDLAKELEALSSACEAYEQVMFPMNWGCDPEAIVEDEGREGSRGDETD
jgi:hypothetical protein